MLYILNIIFSPCHDLDSASSTEYNDVPLSFSRLDDKADHEPEAHMSKALVLIKWNAEQPYVRVKCSRVEKGAQPVKHKDIAVLSISSSLMSSTAADHITWVIHRESSDTFLTCSGPHQTQSCSVRGDLCQLQYSISHTPLRNADGAVLDK